MTLSYRHSQNNQPIEPIGRRINRVIIPGSTGGFYTIFSGMFLLLIAAFSFIYCMIKGVPTIDGFNDLLLAGVGLMGVHTARGVFSDRGYSDIAIQSLETASPQGSTTVQTPDGSQISTEVTQQTQPVMGPIPRPEEFTQDELTKG